MSKYTTEVRYICEQKAGLQDSVQWNSVDEVINLSYDKIFDVPSIPCFNDTHKALLLKKILLHYYTREIGYETVGLWQLNLNRKMREIMPYYNKLYESELLSYDPLKNVDNTLDHTGSYNDDNEVHYTDKDSGTVKDDSTTDTMLRHRETTNNGKTETKKDTIHDGSAWTEYSDTPQGALDGVRSGNYLTNATHVTDTPAYVDTHTEQTKPSTLEYNVDSEGNKLADNKYKDTTDYDNTTTTDMTKTFTKDKDNTKGWDVHTDKQTGKIGTETYQEMVMKYRETFLNIDMMIIKELSDLFMKVW